MGAGQSTEKVIHNEIPIQFSKGLVNHLSDELASPETHPTQQSVLDHHVRSRIQAEIARLREEEEEVRLHIERALERENIDREGSLAGLGNADEIAEDDRTPGSADGAVHSGTSLREDLKEVQSKVERFHQRRNLDQLPEVKATSESLVECYRKNPKTSLDCWREVAEFKDAVARAEQKFIDTLR